jgi:HPr kinase/phosphorylase
MVNMITLTMPEKNHNNSDRCFTTVHGVLLDIHGFGVLIIGPSGIGKSINAAELISRGHKLVSDDVVEVVKTDSGLLVGKAPDNIKNLMEIRGVGIINVVEIFGGGSVRDQREIDMIIELLWWDSGAGYDRLGIKEDYYNMLGVNLPYKLIPVGREGNTSTIIEIAARNQMARISNESENIENIHGSKSGIKAK